MKQVDHRLSQPDQNRLLKVQRKRKHRPFREKPVNRGKSHHRQQTGHKARHQKNQPFRQQGLILPLRQNQEILPAALGFHFLCQCADNAAQKRPGAGNHLQVSLYLRGASPPGKAVIPQKYRRPQKRHNQMDPQKRCAFQPDGLAFQKPPDSSHTVCAPFRPYHRLEAAHRRPNQRSDTRSPGRRFAGSVSAWL